MPAQQPPTSQQEIVFSSVNPWQPASALANGEVQSANNVDFSLMNGALTPRRGSVLFGTGGTSPLTQIFHNYNDPSSIITGPLYITDSLGNLYRNPTGTVFTQIASNVTGSVPFPPAISNYRQYTLIAGYPGVYKDDGTNVTEWIKQSPSAPTVVVNTQTAITLTGTYTVTDGSLLGTTSNTATFVTSAGNTACAKFIFTSNTNLTTNGSAPVGNWGVFFADMGFSNPTQLTNVGVDFSIGDATFLNYWHAEISPQNGGVIVTSNNSEALINAQLTVGTNTSSTVTSQDKLDIWSNLSQYNFNPLSFVPTVANSLSPLAFTVPQFNLVAQNVVGTLGADLWANIGALRFTFQTIGTCTMTTADPVIYGDERHPLTDVNSGYYYWQTFATTNTSGFKIDEGAPSSPAGPFMMQNAQAVVKQVGTATGTLHGVNAIITYRQGGYMQDSYAISTVSYGTALSTITDTQNDIDALTNNFVMPRGLMPQSFFPGICSSISQAVADRIFIAAGNLIRWSLPGQIGSFPLDSYQEVSHIGDQIQGILAWNPGLVIVNRSSVYEMYGTDFEHGAYTLTRTGSRRGSVAIKTIIHTPYGIPLLNQDGITMFVPGYNSDQDIGWFADKFSDVFKGNGATDPAALKGSRVPALNGGNIHFSCATYSNHKLYIAMPTGNSTYANTVFILDFAQKQAWYYTYPFNITAMLADQPLNAIFAITDTGAVMVIESGAMDHLTNGTGTSINWSARTKLWTSDSTTVLENLSIDCEGTGIVAKAYYDNSTNPVLSTITNANRAWSIPPLNGTFVNELAFDLTGSSTGSTLSSIYAMRFGMLAEPPRVQYYRTEYDEHEWQADKLWDVHYADIDIQGTSTVTYVMFVDTTAVATNSIVGPTLGRQVFEVAYPPEIYGRVAYTTYTNTGSTFKHWNTHRDARNEPAKINYWRTDIESLEENIIEAFDTDINPNGTVFGTVYVDNIAVLTATITGTNRLSYTFDVPIASYPHNTYGRTLFVAYTGTGLKHYNTWWHKRPEPDRWTEYITSWDVEDEREIKVFLPEISCMGNTVLATTWLNVGNTGTLTAVSTHTMTGTARTQYTFSLPVEKYARSVRVSYQCGTVGTNGTFTYGGANGPRFKHYRTVFDGPKEPPRVTLYRTGPYAFPSNHFLKTWQPLLDPLNGTVTGTLIVEDTVIQTSTFTGNRRQWYTVGIDLNTNADYALTTGSRWEAIYSCAANQQFKHYDSKMESDTDPFRKLSWSFHYRKIGGATQLDVARFWSAFTDVEDTPDNDPILGTYWWDIDGTNFNTGTLTFDNNHQFTDRIPFPPGARGRLFEFRLYAPSTIKIHNVNVDMMEEGIKSLTRRGHPGTPQDPNG